MHDLKKDGATHVLKNELLAHVSLVPRDDKIFDMIYTAIQNSRESTWDKKVVVRSVFQVEKPAEKVTYRPF